MIKTLTRIPVAHYSNLKARSGYSIKIDDMEIALFKVTTGEVYALENHSPHPKGGVLSEGLVSGHYVYCPVYDWKISLADGTVQAPDEGQVRAFQVEINDDIIFIVL
ncbi:nitrite reductase small subunit NirD [Neobacillus sp. MM2021_6]|uniref:nitrite reductase small subunit NirD n=1 Tax=Bacillaceae TaxID=186817 RepID=UPI0014074FB5|nr:MULTISPECIES: nitrite reductase small subunit NirD [Bacillaceae]MBO0959285.1 nitrite reductase small subunit NirD [Neobacillus sp. MM2021_6]NHC20608.1 nitrite reductase small subunit NirD [Bacillus sp. MM2020_4]WML37909.1 nitrite reductase small subunit NirD [Neobacillus sp. OS1-2]